MKKFLANFLKRDQTESGPPKGRLEPKLGQASLNTHPEDTFIGAFSELTENSHPDELFIDYGDWDSIEAPAGNIPAAKSDQEFLNNPSTEPLDEHLIHDFPTSEYEPKTGFNEEWCRSIKYGKILKNINIFTTFDNCRNTYFHYAAAFASAQLLRQLILLDWPIEQLNEFGKSPIDFAKYYENHENYEILKFLVSNGTRDEFNSVNSDFYEPSEGFIEDWVDKVRSSQFSFFKNNRTYKDNIGNTIVHYTAAFGKIRDLKFLIKNEWSVNDPNYFGKTPFDFSIQYRNSLVSYFFENLLEENNLDFSLEKNQTTEGFKQATKVVSEHKLDTFSRADQNNEKTKIITNLEIDETFNINDAQPKTAGHNPPDQNDTSAGVVEVYEIISQCIKCEQTFEGFDKNTKLSFCPACGTRIKPIEAKTTDDLTEKKLVQGLTDVQEQIKELDNTIYHNEDATGSANLDPFSEIFSDNIDYDLALNPNNPAEHNNHGRVSSHETASKKIEGSTTDLTLASHEVHPETTQVEEPPDTSPLVEPNKFEDDFLSVDSAFDQFEGNTDEIFEHYSPPKLGHNSDNNRANEWTKNLKTTDDVEDWELFLDENLEEATVNFDTIYTDEVELEDYKIFKYSNKLLNNVVHYNLKDQSKTHKILIEIFADFPFYQSYAAIERLVANGCQIDEIYDIYQIKLLWLNNPNSWLIRRYSKLEGTWVVTRSPNLKNTMTWKLAKDLSDNYALSEIENLICVTWQDEWLNLEPERFESLNGISPEYSFYSNYLSCKRVPLPSNVKAW